MAKQVKKLATPDLKQKLTPQLLCLFEGRLHKNRCQRISGAIRAIRLHVQIDNINRAAADVSFWQHGYLADGS